MLQAWLCLLYGAWVSSSLNGGKELLKQRILSFSFCPRRHTTVIVLRNKVLKIWHLHCTRGPFPPLFVGFGSSSVRSLLFHLHGVSHQRILDVRVYAQHSQKLAAGVYPHLRPLLLTNSRHTRRVWPSFKFIRLRCAASTWTAGSRGRGYLRV